MRRLPSHFADIPPAGGEADQQQAGRVAAADAVGVSRRLCWCQSEAKAREMEVA